MGYKRHGSAGHQHQHVQFHYGHITSRGVKTLVSLILLGRNTLGRVRSARQANVMLPEAW